MQTHNKADNFRSHIYNSSVTAAWQLNPKI